LSVHKIELEMQLEELNAAHAAAEALRDRYEELLEFAPVGYVVLNTRGKVLEANLEIAEMLGVPRKDLVGFELTLFIAKRDRKALTEFLDEAMDGAKPERPSAVSLEVTALRRGGGTMRARLIVRTPSGSAPPRLLVVIHDVTEQR